MAEPRVSESSQSDDDLPSIGDDPFQPRSIKFPKRSFGEKKPVLRSFQSAWFDKWSWLHYDQVLDKAYCHTCIEGVKQGKVKRFRNSPGDNVFLTTGYTNWKDASGEKHGGFNIHERSQVSDTLVAI